MNDFLLAHLDFLLVNLMFLSPWLVMAFLDRREEAELQAFLRENGFVAWVPVARVVRSRR